MVRRPHAAVRAVEDRGERGRASVMQVRRGEADADETRRVEREREPLAVGGAKARDLLGELVPTSCTAPSGQASVG